MTLQLDERCERRQKQLTNSIATVTTRQLDYTEQRQRGEGKGKRDTITEFQMVIGILKYTSQRSFHHSDSHSTHTSSSQPVVPLIRHAHTLSYQRPNTYIRQGYRRWVHFQGQFNGPCGTLTLLLHHEHEITPLDSLNNTHQNPIDLIFGLGKKELMHAIEWSGGFFLSTGLHYDDVGRASVQAYGENRKKVR